MNKSQERIITVKDFFFCYNPKLAKYLKYEKGLNFIVKAIHPNTNRIFWMFVQTAELNKYILEFSQNEKSI